MGKDKILFLHKTIYMQITILKSKTKVLIIAILALFTISCNKSGNFSSADISIINSKTTDSTLYVYKITVPKDSIVLRNKSTELNNQTLQSIEYKNLSSRMLFTVKHPKIDGVGIAAPQIGINKRVIAVQRYDKQNFPFEVYPNIYIERYYGKTKTGREGCLSVPNYNSNVERSDSITITYICPLTLESKKEEIGGFTSVIFQHEVDHLEGKIYTDY